MRTVWTTAPGADPRLRRVFPGIRADAVVPAVVDGAPVRVTASDAHEPEDCRSPETHDCGVPVLQVWDAGGALVRTVAGVGGPLLVATAAGGRPTAVTCGWSETPAVVDLSSGDVRELAGHRDVVRGLAVTAGDDPAVVSVGWDGTARLTSLATGDVHVLEIGGRLDAVATLGSGAATVLAVAGDGVGLWSPGRGELLRSLPAPGGVHRIAVWPGDGTVLATLSAGGDVRVWAVASGSPHECSMPARRLTHDLAAVRARDGRRLLAVSDHEAVHLWDVDADRPAGPPLVGPTEWSALAAGGAGSLLTASAPDESVGVWRVDVDVPPRGTGHTSTVTALAVGNDGLVVGGGTDGTVGAWRLSDGAREPAVGVMPAPVRAVATAPADHRVAVLAGGGDLNASADRALHRWFPGGPDQPVVVDHGGDVRLVVAAVLVTHAVAVTAGSDTAVRITDVATGAPVAEIPGRAPATGLAVGDVAGRPVLAVSRLVGPLQLWDLLAGVPHGAPVAAEPEPGERVHGLVRPAGEPAVVTSIEAEVRVRVLHSGAAALLDPDATAVVTAVAVRDGSRPLAAVGRADASVSLVDVATGAVVGGTVLPYPATALCWSPGGDLVAASRRDLVRLAP